MVEQIELKNRLKLKAEKTETEDHVEITLHVNDSENCLLHWGLSRNPGSAWHLPPEHLWPDRTEKYDRRAVRSPFTCREGDCSVSLAFEKTMDYPVLSFVLFYPETGRWDNNHGKNYHLQLPVQKRESSLLPVLEEEMKGKDLIFRETFALDDEWTLASAVYRKDKRFEILLLSDTPGQLTLHWGIALSRYDWSLPKEVSRPRGSVVFDEKAVQTPFAFSKGLNRLEMSFSEEQAPQGIVFVLTNKEEGRWFKNRNRNFFMPVTYKQNEKFPGLSRLTEEIIHGETGDHSWTLMHRFNLCHDLIEDVRRDTDGLAMIYVWMRFSMLRQLDWQRRYNTKPRELSHAQDRLTLKIAEIYAAEPENRDLLRMIMSTLGRGGEGQKIRDEILHIMHRNHIKEVAGHFLEEWHQKLHNNTTPDDIVICRAYLEFLRSGGSSDTFYRTLEEGGVTRKRLKSFDRPITTEPDFIPHLKNALISEFENFLRLLKSVHSGTDLESAISSAEYLFDDRLSELLSYIWDNRATTNVSTESYINNITEARRILRDRLNTEKDGRRTRDILFLDLALEEFMRVVIERNIHEKPDGDPLVDLTSAVLENVRLSHDNEELFHADSDWDHLAHQPRFSRDWSLHAKSVLERISRATGSLVDRYYQLLQPKAEYLGKVFRADSWTVTLFSEEVVRGMPPFVLSMLIRHLEPVLRRHAKLGDWQVVSSGHAVGRIETAESLSSVQGKHYDRPVIIVTDRVRGDEEPPENATAIITTDHVDLVSHIAVRARNAGLLFATCYDAECFSSLKSLKGHILKLTVNVSGDVKFEEAKEEAAKEQPVEFRHEKKALPESPAYVISSKDFSETLVGGKSGNLKRLENRLPEWIHLPVSAALPFGTFEKVLSLDINMETAKLYYDLLEKTETDTKNTLEKIRCVILDLIAPEELIASLETLMTDAELGHHGRWDEIWTCIKRVWASKWNERAYLSRRAMKLSHEDIFMAVLIQEVVEAEYAFVIHTANPFTQDRNELYAEIVPGLGETLVGNYPGRAFSFVSNKLKPEPEILSYPGKSRGLFGGGLIFRSDSNAEDLPGYAGAGLYDSVMLDPPREVTLNYREDKLVWDEEFKHTVMNTITEIGTQVEAKFGFPQDIEGAYSRGKYYVVQTRPQVGIDK